ncbi:hypothetical protein PPERSA_12845 [Pseudocohnilembus persalinus]|uniref:Uncharacterized protein n=1 Tax=Pseudocohnilembus persalinus TaxID=266149 RepID=A0A0V0QUW9_PSEPJ|nr:hypothetical protein PPERSA_12845 [Pseudocohnilembus persalinus]|eukprot:KRX06156.1 hypothetical protein PPERSA_12845 [Pseudocohnilembus persalinus]
MERTNIIIAQNGFRILGGEQEFEVFFLGLFFLEEGGCQTVYFEVVEVFQVVFGFLEKFLLVFGVWGVQELVQQVLRVFLACLGPVFYGEVLRLFVQNLFEGDQFVVVCLVVDNAVFTLENGFFFIGENEVNKF